MKKLLLLFILLIPILSYASDERRITNTKGEFWFINTDSSDTIKIKINTDGHYLLYGTSRQRAIFTIDTLTTTQRDNVTPRSGSLIYNSTVSQLQSYINGAWTKLGNVGDMLTTDIPDSVQNHFRSGYEDSLQISDSTFVIETDGDIGINAKEKLGYLFSNSATLTNNSTALGMSLNGSSSITPFFIISGKTPLFYIENQFSSGTTKQSAYVITQGLFSDHISFINGLYFKETGYSSNSRIRLGLGFNRDIVMIRADSLSLGASDGNTAFYWNLNSTLTDNYVLTYDAATGMAGWEAAPGAAGGDNVSVDGGATTDPDFVSTGDIDFVNTSNTITANINTNSVDGTHIALGSDAQGDVMYYNGTDWARLGAGTNGQYLKTQGAGANPLWATVSGGSGDSTWISTQTRKAAIDSIINYNNSATTNIIISGDTLESNNVIQGTKLRTIGDGTNAYHDFIVSGTTQSTIGAEPSNGRIFLVYNSVEGEYDIIVKTNSVNIADSLLSANLDVTGNITVSGTVDGKDIATNAGMLNEAETISANWVNTANPWDENEIVSTVLVESERATATAGAKALLTATGTNNVVNALSYEIDTNVLSDTLLARIQSGGTNELSIDGLSGNIPGNAATATALASNGTNASTGNAILGVDASGNAEGSFDVWTEAENTAAGYLPKSVVGDSIAANAIRRINADGTILSFNDTTAIIAGSNISITTSNDTMTITSTGGAAAFNVRDGGSLISAAPSDVDFNGTQFNVNDSGKADSVVISISSVSGVTGANEDDVTSADIEAVYSSETVVTAVAGEDTILIRDQTDNGLKKALLPSTSEVNNLETIATGIQNGEIFVGTGASSGSYIAMSVLDLSNFNNDLPGSDSTWVSTQTQKAKVDSIDNYNNKATTNIAVGDTLKLDALTASRILALDANKQTVNTITGANLNTSISDENAIFESARATAAAGAKALLTATGSNNVVNALSYELNTTVAGDTFKTRFNPGGVDALSFESSTSNDIDPDRLNGDAVDNNLIDHEIGGLEADINAYDGLIGITGGTTYNQTGTNTQIIIFDGAGAPTSAALSGDATMTNGGVVTVADNSHNHTASNISDQNAGTDITSDMEEETHASEHAGNGLSASSDNLIVNVHPDSAIGISGDSLAIRVDDATINIASNKIQVKDSGVSLTTKVTGTLPVANGGTGATTLNDLITLTTHTTGNYVASITNGAGITGGNGGSEGAALTLAATLGTDITRSELNADVVLTDTAYVDFQQVVWDTTVAGGPSYASKSVFNSDTWWALDATTPETLHTVFYVPAFVDSVISLVIYGETQTTTGNFDFKVLWQQVDHDGAGLNTFSLSNSDTVLVASGGTSGDFTEGLFDLATGKPTTLVGGKKTYMVITRDADDTNDNAANDFNLQGVGAYYVRKQSYH